MSESRKYNIGPLPEQDAPDVRHFEESEILWGRVVGVAFLGVLCLVFVLSWVLGAFEAQDTGASQTSSISLKPQVLSDQQVSDKDVPDKQMPDEESTENLSQTLDVSVTEASEMAASVETASTVSESAATNQPDVSEPVTEPNSALESTLMSTVTTLHEGIQDAELVIGLADGSHSNPLGYKVPMSDEGIIKVMLKTRMENLKGTVLYHDWYRQDQRMARVKIPVNTNEQASYSSKFVNQQMLGEWTVKVRDSANELYAQANFKVE